MLTGIKVLDLTNVLAGPFCGHQLAHLGAEVIKVEAPGRGDLARQLGADAELNARRMGISFLAQNAGKRSVCLNLKDPRGKALFLELLRDCDVLLENFRPGVMARLGLSFDELKLVNPKLIYAAISGFGQDGVWRDRPAYDQIIQSLSGVMSITGDDASAPLRVGYPLCDTIGGLTAAMAICAALNDRSKPQLLDVSMLEATLATMGWVVSNYLIGGITPQALGNENMTAAPSGAFQCADGLLNIAANEPKHWQALAKHLGLSGLIEHPDFAARDDRKHNRYRLKGELEQVLSTRAARDWERELVELGVPCAAVMTVPDILAHSVIRERGLIQKFDDVPGLDHAIEVLSIAVKRDGQALKVSSPPPVHGADSQTLLGLTDSEFAALKAAGVTA